LHALGNGRAYRFGTVRAERDPDEWHQNPLIDYCDA